MTQEYTKPAISPPLEGTVSAADAIARVRDRHDAIINLMLASPELHQGEVAKRLGYSQPWVSRVINSDAFRARMAQRSADLIDPVVSASIDEKLRTAASISLDILTEKLIQTRSTDLAKDVASISLKAAGYGARQTNVAVQANFVVAMPAKAESGQAWAARHNSPVIDMPEAAGGS